MKRTISARCFWQTTLISTLLVLGACGGGGDGSAAKTERPLAACAGVASSFNYGENEALAYQASTVIGSGTQGYVDGPSASAQFNGPRGMAVGGGYAYVADTGNSRIRRVALNEAGFPVSTVAADVTFNRPLAVALDGVGNVYVADTENHRIRKIKTDGTVCTVAGSGVAGFAEGRGEAAQFAYPNAVAIDVSGNLYVADQDNHRIRRVDVNGVVSTLAGSATAGNADGVGAAASFSRPAGLTVEPAGTYVYEVDIDSPRVRRITVANGEVVTLAGSTNGYKDDIGTAAQFGYPYGIAFSSNGWLHIADTWNHVVRRIRPSDRMVQTAAGIAGSPGTDSSNTTPTSQQFNWPAGIFIDVSGYLWVVDTNNHRLRRFQKT